MNYEFDEKNMSSTKFFYGEPTTPVDTGLGKMVEDIHKVYDEMEMEMIFGPDKYCQPCKYEIPMKDKTLEVLENEFALKYSGPYKSFKAEQARQLIEFIKTYTQNHEEI